MTKEEAKHLSEVIKAYSEGKNIEAYNSVDGKWWDVCANPSFTLPPDYYRIKSEPKLRPYANTEELMGKTNKQIVRAFDKACNELAEAVNQQLFEGCRDWYWIGDLIGGVCDFDGCDALNAETMRLILAEEVTYEQYSEWLEAGLDYNRDKEGDEQRWINLQSWLKGARYEMFDNK